MNCDWLWIGLFGGCAMDNWWMFDGLWWKFHVCGMRCMLDVWLLCDGCVMDWLMNVEWILWWIEWWMCDDCLKNCWWMLDGCQMVVRCMCDECVMDNRLSVPWLWHGCLMCVWWMCEWSRWMMKLIVWWMGEALFDRCLMDRGTDVDRTWNRLDDCCLMHV